VKLARARCAGVAALVVGAVLAAACGAGDSTGGAGPAEETLPRANPSDPRIQEGVDLVRGGEFAAGQALLEEVVAEWPDTGRARYFLGMAIHKQKNYAQALPHLLAAREAGEFEDSNTVDYFLGWCHYNLGQLTLAREAMERFVLVNPREGDGFFVLGLVAIDEGRSEDAELELGRAVTLFGEALELAPEERKKTFALELGKAYGRLGDVFFDRESFEQARDRYLQSVSIVRNHYIIWYKLSQVFEELGQQEEASFARERYEEYRPQRGATGSGG